MSAREEVVSSPLPVHAERAVQLLVVAIAASAANYARTMLGPLQETMSVALSLSDNQIALLQGAALALPQVLAAVPLGLLADRHSRVRLLQMVALLNVVGSLLTAASSNFYLLLLARCVIGLAVAATAPAALSLIADLYGPAQRGRATMVMHVGGVGGLSAAFALGGALLTIFGSSPNGWRWAMVGMTAPLAIVVLLMLALREPPRNGRAVETPSLRRAFAELWTHRPAIAPLMVGWIMVQVGDIAALVWAAPTLSRNFGLAPDRVGALMATMLLVSGLLGPVLGGVMADLCHRAGGPRRTLTLLGILALLSAPASLFSVAPGVATAGVLLFVFVTIGMCIGTMTMTLSIVVIPNELRGLCVAVYTVAGALFGMSLAPLMVSVLSGAIGGPATLGRALAAVGVTTGLLGTLMFGLGRRYLPRVAMP